VDGLSTAVLFVKLSTEVVALCKIYFKNIYVVDIPNRFTFTGRTKLNVVRFTFAGRTKLKVVRFTFTGRTKLNVVRFTFAK
jgi:hypothetical protein